MKNSRQPSKNSSTQNSFDYEPEYAVDPEVGVKHEWNGVLLVPIAGEAERVSKETDQRLADKAAVTFARPHPRVKMDFGLSRRLHVRD